MAMQTDTKQSLAQRWQAYQPSKSTLTWACAATAVATIIVGFSWGGWVTGGTSLAHAKAASDISRSELASLVCIDKFNAAPDRTAQLTTLNAITNSFKRRQFIEVGGWATMPGQTSPDRRAAEGCAAALAA